MNEPVKDLCNRMALLHVRYDVVFREPTPANPPYIPLAEALESGLRGDVPEAVRIARGVVDPADLERPGFWATPLGRLMFSAGCFKGETVTQAFAAGVLGCSRQWVHQMLDSGVLRPGLMELPPREVRAGDVRVELRAKLDRLVK